MNHNHIILNNFYQHIHALAPHITEADFAIFAQGLQIMTLPPKAMLYYAGDTVNQIHYVAQGLVKAFYTDEAGNQININFLREGVYVTDYFAFSTGKPSKYSFQCLEYCVLIAYSVEYQEYCSQHIPHIERYFRKMIEQAFFSYLQRTESFLLADAESRYVRFMQDYPDVFRRISVSDLCSYLGIQRQHLTRIRKKLLNNKI